MIDAVPRVVAYVEFTKMARDNARHHERLAREYPHDADQELLEAHWARRRAREYLGIAMQIKDGLR